MAGRTGKELPLDPAPSMPATRHTHLRNPGAPVRLFIANRRFTREPSAPGVSPGSAARSHVTAHADLRAWPPHLPSPRPPTETPSGATPHETRASFPSQRVSPCSETEGNHVAPLGHREGGRVTVGVTSLASLLSGRCACRLVGGTESFLPGRLPNNSSNTGMATRGFPHAGIQDRRRPPRGRPHPPAVARAASPFTRGQ